MNSLIVNWQKFTSSIQKTMRDCIKKWKGAYKEFIWFQIAKHIGKDIQFSGDKKDKISNKNVRNLFLVSSKWIGWTGIFY